MRLGLFGGSFDPVHKGHLMLAESCARQAGLDEVWFVPNARQPLKPQGPQASNHDRVAMLRLALAGREHFRLSDIEIRRGGVSFTVDTLRAIHAEQPEAELFFLMGADSLSEFPLWRRPKEILEFATPLVVRRAGAPEPDFAVLAPLTSEEQLDRIQLNQIEMPEVPISSSEIRARIAAGEDWQLMTPEDVAEYIVTHRLYLDA